MPNVIGIILILININVIYFTRNGNLTGAYLVISRKIYKSIPCHYTFCLNNIKILSQKAGADFYSRLIADNFGYANFRIQGIYKYFHEFLRNYSISDTRPFKKPALFCLFVVNIRISRSIIIYISIAQDTSQHN